MSERRSFDWSGLRSDGAASGATEAAPGAGGPAPVPPVEQNDRPLAPPIPLRVNDLKQYAYCPRIVFYQYAMPVQRKATFKMGHGKAVEEKLEHLERRRKMREYGLAEGTRRFQVWLTSQRLALSGRLDLLISTPLGGFPVDFKDTREPVRHNHHVQLCAYALLVEDCLGQPVSTGFIYRVPRDDIVVVDITAELRLESLSMLQAIRAMIQAERMPAPTPVRARCTDCEYRNYCGDVF